MNILTIDLEDWFHILAHFETASPEQWVSFESRVERNTDWILDTLARHGHHATFFCLGWIANKHPALIKKIVAQGHEIGCHSMNHQLVYYQTPAEFRKDLGDCIHLLEDVSGKKIKTYRAPGFSVSKGTNWVFDILLDNGIEHDCSVFPVPRNHGGYEQFSSLTPCLISANGRQLKEFPMSVARFAGRNFVYSGGGYFRLCPYPLMKSLMTHSTYAMTYFHPRDFDPGQPALASLPFTRKLKLNVGLKSAKSKFDALLNDFAFMSVAESADKIPWHEAGVVCVD